LSKLHGVELRSGIMMKRTVWKVGLGLIVMALLSLSLWAEKIPLRPQGYVSDFAQMLSSSTRQEIEQLAIRLQQEHQVEMAVVTVPSLGDTPLEDFATNLFAQWGIGKKGANTGLLLLVAKGERKIRIEVGYGLEDKVPDAVSAEIVREMESRFRQGDFNGGFLVGAQMVTSAVGGTLELPRARRSRSPGVQPGGPNVGFWIIFFFIIVLSVIQRIARAATGRPAYRSGSSIPWWLIFFLGSGRGGGSSWGGGGFSGGGGGFGGFGGGMSGGGGASGGW
jgi:uncharacterized protein